MAGEWAKFVADNKAAEKKDNGVKYIGTRHPEWPVDEKKIFPEQQINNYANKIVDKSYQQTKNKNPFTQSAEIAKDLLSFELKDGFIENKDNRRVDTVKEAVKFNEALDKNLLDHKTDDYLAKLKKKKLLDDIDKDIHFTIENSSVKHPDYPKAAPKPRLTNDQRRMLHYEKAWQVKNPKLAELPIIKNNINNRKFSKPAPKPLNKYQVFKEKQKQALEDKKFNEGFEKEYGTRAIEKDLRDKENANRRAGRAPHEGFSSSQQIVAEHAKDRAKKILKALKTDPIKIEPTYIDYRLKLNDPGPTISFEEHMAKTAPIEPEPPGITGLEEVKNFRNIIDMTDQKFPKQARGIGPFISGEDDAN